MMAAAQSHRCLISGCYPAQVVPVGSFRSGYRFGLGRVLAASRPNHRRGFHAAVISAAHNLSRWGTRTIRCQFGFWAGFSAIILLSGCGSIKCDLLGSDSLRDECENGVMVKVYSVPTWYPGQDLRSLWQADKAAQHGGLY